MCSRFSKKKKKKRFSFGKRFFFNDGGYIIESARALSLSLLGGKSFYRGKKRLGGKLLFTGFVSPGNLKKPGRGGGQIFFFLFSLKKFGA